MRSYCAVYIDAGYLLASAATRVTGTSLRSGVTVNHRVLIQRLIAQAEQASGLPILRVNWYDSAAGPRGIPDAEQDAIAMLRKVKVRLGRRSHSGEQKGVDLRIGLDLATHGRGRLADVAYLVSGDDDLTEAVEEAQGHGVQVVVLAVPDADGRPHGVAQHLLREADEWLLIDPAIIDECVHPARPVPRPPAQVPPPTPPSDLPAGPKPAPPSPAALAARRMQPAPQSGLVYSTHSGRAEETAPDAHVLDTVDEVCRGVIAAWSRTAGPHDLAGLQRSRPSIPGDLDRALLVDLSDRLGVYDIDEPTRHALRERFWERLDTDDTVPTSQSS